ncbi:MAG: hypothetical protein RR382_08730 [Tannerellaceae bacterium]
MVKRYPHTAILKLQRGGGMVDGEWSDGEEYEVYLIGRLYKDDPNRIVKNQSGNEVITSYRFIGKKIEYEGTPISLTVDGIERSVIDIEQWQTYYEIIL